MRILIIRPWQASCCVFGMPGVPQALMVATSVPGTAVAGRARSDAFARLLDTGTLTDAPDSTEASPGQTEAAAPVRGLLNRSASLLKPDAPAPQITTAPKPNPPDRTQVKPPARAKHELKANGKKPQTDQPSVTTAAQPELSPTTATPIVEARPPSNASTTPTRAAPEDIAAVQVQGRSRIGRRHRMPTSRNRARVLPSPNNRHSLHRRGSRMGRWRRYLQRL